MLKEKASVSKREDHIFDVGVADLSPLSGARADVVQGSWLWCMSGPAFRAFHDRLLFFSMWNMGRVDCFCISRYGKDVFILRDSVHKLLN
jgi:hypothetical protein